jgi:hypothetical protein
MDEPPLEHSLNGRDASGKAGHWTIEMGGVSELTRAGWTKEMLKAGDKIFAAWIQDEESDRPGVWGAWWRENGTQVIAPRRLADAGKTTWNLLYFQAFDSSGTPSGDAIRVTDTPASSVIAAIRPWRSGFALAWSEYEGPAGEDHGSDGRSQVVVRLIR